LNIIAMVILATVQGGEASYEEAVENIPKVSLLSLLSLL